MSAEKELDLILIGPDQVSSELENPALQADPPGWPQDPDNPRLGRIGSARFGFTEESGSVNGPSSSFIAKQEL